jgi:AraC-like DNA-binding protein
MSYFEVPIQSPAQRIASAIWSTDAPHRSLILPDGCTDLLFLPKQKSTFVVGVMTRAVVVSQHTEAIGVRLQPWAARALLGVDAARLRDQRIRLEEVSLSLSSSFQKVRCFAEVEDALYALAARAFLQREVDPRIVRAVELLQENPQETITSLAKEAALSTRQLQRVFLSHAGVAPKTFARILRLQKAKQISRDSSSLAALAVAVGYADQAHLCREVQSLTGCTPSRFFSEMSDLFKPTTSLSY